MEEQLPSWEFLMSNFQEYQKALEISNRSPQQKKPNTGAYKHRFWNSFVLVGCSQGHRLVIQIDDNDVLTMETQWPNHGG